jgi:hypothetical protein
MSRSMTNPVASFALIALAGFLPSTAAAQQPATVFASVRSSFGVAPDVVGPENRQPAMAGGTYSLHTGVRISDANGPITQDYGHLPIAQPAGADVWPVRTYYRNPPGGGFGGRMEQACTPPQPIPAYNTRPKSFDGLTYTSNPLVRLQTTPNGRNTQGTAEAMITCTDRGAGMPGRFRVSSAGSYMEVQADRGGYKGEAAASVLDPIHYSNVEAGSSLFETISLPAGFGGGVTPGADGVATTTLEVGANLPGLSGGPLGFSHAGNPLLFRLSVSFSGPERPLVWLDTTDASPVSFLRPDGTTGGDLQSFVSDRIHDSMTYDPAAGTWSLASNLDLFSLDANVSQAMADLVLDTAMLGHASVPAPGASALAAMALAMSCGRRQRVAGRA